MDSIKNSSTSVSAVGGYGVISYRTFSATSSLDATTAKAAELDGLSCVEARLREAKRLVYLDRQKTVLWLFEPGTSPPALDHGSLQSQQLNGLQLSSQSEGDIKAADLARLAGRHHSLSAAQAGGQYGSTASNARALQAANIRAFQSNQQGSGVSAANSDATRQHDPLSVYESFMSAVVGSISYNLSRFHHMIPLNYRTFVSYPRPTTAENPDDDDDDFTILGGMDCLITTLDAHLSTSGTMVISTSVSNSTEIHQLERILTVYDAHEDFLGELVRISPCGIIARYVGHETSAVGSERDGLGSTKRARAIQQWKADTLRWLRMKGLVLPDMDEEGKWVRIQLQPPQHATKDTNDPSATLCRECLWPAALCFFYGPIREDGDLSTADVPGHLRSHDDQDPGVMWWQGPSKQGFTDPLWQAYNWFLGKPEREKAIEARKKARQAQEENVQPTQEPTMAYPSSPLYSRGSAYGDLQVVSGVYPTPPDAVLPPNAGGHAAMDGLLMSQPNQEFISQTGNTGTGADGSATAEHPAPPGTTPGEHLDPSRAMNTPADGQDAEADNNDDLFEDMDEEMFGGNDVTEADFNFFDDGEGDFADLMDVSQPATFEEQQQDTSPAEAKFEDASPVVQVSGQVHAEEEPVTYKSEITATPAVPSADIEMSEPKDETKPGDIFQDPEIQVDEPKGEAEEEVQITREPSPPLGPARIHEKLFPSVHAREADTGAKDFAKTKAEGGAIFNTVDFNQMMQLTDSKYAAGGQFHFPEKANGDTMTAMNYRSANLSIRAPPGQISRPTSSAQSLTLESTSKFIRSIVVPKHTSDDSTMDGLSEDSDSYSDISASSGSFNEETASVAHQKDSGLLAPVHKKWGSSNAGTPMVGTPGTLQLDSGAQDTMIGESDGIMSELPALSSLEPGPSDWPLARLPPPMVKVRRRPGADTRSRRGSFSLASAASTPSSDGRSEAFTEAPALNLKEVINITQMLADQVIHSTLDLMPEDDDPSLLCSERQTGGCRKLAPIQKIQNAVRDLFQQVSECDMLKYASIQDVIPEPAAANKTQHKSVQRRNNNADPQGSMFFTIPTPHVRLRRGEDTWDVLPPALSFWEPLGLSPTNGPKNIMAYCVYPSSDQLKKPVTSFIDSISMAYESCKFGSHVRGPDIEQIATNGRVSAFVNSGEGDHWRPTAQNCLQAVRDTCSSLGRHLSRIDFKKHAKAEDSSTVDALVVYLVNPFSDPHNLWQLCSAFWALFQAYLPSVPSNRAVDDSKPELVLQLVPVKYIASFEAPVVLEPSLLTRFAREIYDRCPPREPSHDHTALSIYSAPSIQLEESLPKSIPFRVTSEPPSDLLHENSYIHVGYAISVDGTWLTAAWTDNPGKHQATVSYCLNNRSFLEVAREIYQTSLEIMSARRVTWRLCIARAGVMEREEQDAWQALVTSPCPLVIGTALVSIEPNPSFCMTSNLPALSASQTLSSGNAGVSTPGGNTPQPGVSPDAHGFTPAATPSDGNTSAPAVDPANDPDARLIDVTDESWGVILQHRLHNSNSTTEFRPALASGYLIKRGADSNTDALASSTGKSDNPDTPRGPVAVGVNLLWIGSTPGGHTPQRAAAAAAAAQAQAAAAAHAAAQAHAHTHQSATPTPTPSAHNPNISIPLQHLEAAAAAAGGASGNGNVASSAGATGGMGSNINSPLPSPAGGAMGQGIGAAAAASTGGGGGGPFAANQARTTYDTVLKEFLVMYRGLGLLARLKGMRGTRGGAVPWHVAAAMRGVKALERCV
ncbi:Mediator complex subunit Med13 [Macrophomina phaseolina MS6]|uniref:Mediator of RNA polymerase II transcription subunit 13 n=1 Tax=Macrophomina phaseolina (strain MS6) TaxID=1126212 RepID=K2QNH8_MACPH|nr:Mediator complex subunit Med13 [Macrophomina phaseolina MS6]